MPGWLLRLYFWIGFITLGLDWLSKHWARGLFGGVKAVLPGVIEIRVVRNPGVFQGLFSEPGALPLLLSLSTTAVLCALLVYLAWRSDPAKSMRHWAFACMIGGAFANGLDRAVHGYVLDFLSMGPLGIYNLADFAVLAGAGIFLIDLWKKRF